MRINNLHMLSNDSYVHGEKPYPMWLASLIQMISKLICISKIMTYHPKFNIFCKLYFWYSCVFYSIDTKFGGGVRLLGYLAFNMALSQFALVAASFHTNTEPK